MPDRKHPGGDRDRATVPDRRRNFRNGLLAAVACLLVAQVLLPADGTSAAAGDGLPLAMLWLFLLNKPVFEYFHNINPLFSIMFIK